MHLLRIKIVLPIMLASFAIATPLALPSDINGDLEARDNDEYTQTIGESREDFTKNAVRFYYNKWIEKHSSEATVVVANTAFDIWGQPALRNATLGWDHPATGGGDYDIDYALRIFSTGTHFELKGDGGFKNWAFMLSKKCHRDVDNGKKLYC